MPEYISPILLAVVLFLLIHSGNTTTCNYDANGDIKETKLRVVGNQKTFPYTKFPVIDLENRECLTNIHLELVEFEPDYLVEQLEGCENLEYLTLNNTNWKNKRFTQKVHLPNLVKFKLYLKNWDHKTSSVEEVLSLYFVYKHPVQDYDDNARPVQVQNTSFPHFIPSFEFRSYIYLLTSVRERLILYYDKDKLQISELPFDISSNFEYSELSLFDTVLNVSSMKEIKSLLYLYNVKLISGRISDILAKSPNARYLTFGLSESSEKERIDLAELPTNLSRFGISNVSIWTSVPNLQLSLRSLTLKNCELNLTLLPKFPNLNALTLTNVTSVGDTNITSIIRENEYLGRVLLQHSLGYTDTDCDVDEDGNIKETELKIIGTKKTFPYTKFPGIDPETRKCVTSLHLELLEFEPDYLVEQLQGCENLKTLTLRNTNWKGKRFTQKVHLPSLLYFKLYLKNWDYKSSSAQEILSFYFVYKHPIQDYNDNARPVRVQNTSLPDFRPSFNFKSEIYILTSVRERLILYYDKDKLQISELPFDISSYFEFIDLYLYNTILNVSSMKEIKRSLVLENVKLISGRISDILTKSPNARGLTFGLSESTEKEIIDLADLSPNLYRFGISYASISNSVPNLQLSLRSLTLKHCELNLTLMPTFEKLNRLTLTNVTSVGDTDITSIIKVIDDLLWVDLDGLTTFDLSALEPSSGSLISLKMKNTPMTQSVETSSLLNNDPGQRTLVLNNSVLDASALTKFPQTFSNIKYLRIYGDFEYLSSLLLIAVQTRVETIRIHLRGDQRVRSRPEFQKTVEFLKNASVPEYATIIKLTRDFSLSELWKYSGPKDHYTQNPYLRSVAIYSYIIPLLLICMIGIFGNLLSGVVLVNKEMRGSNSYILLGLTLCDTMILLTYISTILYFGLKSVFMFWKFEIPEYKFPLFWYEISLASAQKSENIQSLYLYPLNKTAYTGSVYMTVLVTLERYVAVCWPLRSKTILTTKKAIVAITSILALSILLNFPRWLEAQTNTVEEVLPRIYSENPYPIVWKLNRKTASEDLLLYTAYREFYHGWIWITLMYGIPIPLLIGLNLKIWIQLKKRMANQDGLRTSRDQSRIGEELASLTKTLICVSTIFIICNIINGVVTLWILLYNPGDWEPADIEIFSCIPLIINSSVNFIIYCLLGTKFRRVLLDLLRRYWRVVYGIRTNENNVGIEMIVDYPRVSLHCEVTLVENI